jgi:hypothetical protein
MKNAQPIHRREGSRLSWCCYTTLKSEGREELGQRCQGVLKANKESGNLLRQHTRTRPSLLKRRRQQDWNSKTCQSRTYISRGCTCPSMSVDRHGSNKREGAWIKSSLPGIHRVKMSLPVKTRRISAQHFRETASATYSGMSRIHQSEQNNVLRGRRLCQSPSLTSRPGRPVERESICEQ